ncbi:MAG: gfo/Idh/MocA family oxidoreductase, partial [Bryobacteraceae bacterium]|nr:gfo/Idh/MocA family oxidoreductase [Bryobacteraceae bacterium]
SIRLGRNQQSEPELAEYPPDLDHFANFADAVRARDPKLLHAEIEETALSTSLCHLGNISYRLNRELRFDPARRQFIGDPQANALLTRNYRAPYVVPARV